MSGTSTGRKQGGGLLTKEFNSRYLHLWIAITVCLLVILNAALYLLIDQRWSGVRAMGDGVLESHPRLRSLLLAGLAAETVLSILAVFWLARVTARRIGGAFARLGAAFRAVRSGDLDSRLRFPAHDQLGDLEQAFNEMVDSARDRAEPKR